MSESDDTGKSHHRSGELVSGRYRLVRLLGRDGMGEVWEADQLTLRTKVAIKFMFQTLDSTAMERFRIEAQVSAQLGKRTTGVVFVQDAGMTEHGPFVVMELVNGRTLEDVLAVHGRLPVGAVVDLASKMCAPLAVIHEAGIVHRDIKPANIMVMPDGSVKLCDFGIVKVKRETDLNVDNPTETRAGVFLGSPSYMSPEQLRAQPVDLRSDLWSLACVFYELLTGHDPFSYANSINALFTAILKEDAPPPRAPFPTSAAASTLGSPGHCRVMHHGDFRPWKISCAASRKHA